MIKDIKYNGVTTVPSDYASPDGDLAQATNIAIDADGSLRNENDGFLLYYIDGSTGVKTAVSDTFSTNEIYQLAAVGNTLLCLTPDGMFYFLWKEDAYVNLGNHLPEVNLQFAVEGHPDMAMRLTHGRLPMGAHAFQRRRNITHWRKLAGIELP